MAALRNRGRATMAGIRCVSPHSAMLAAAGALSGPDGGNKPMKGE
ncbi:hypothetical protein SAMN05880556_104238 [Azospirillum sp. RU38E]|nr:hypothetical protein SAMN05880556_104238 [Azospirillum sp. RU38E]SNS58063.1 hypothetical protein SAMN05880591_104238 [Azospirillum sp. RU37A]